MPEPINEFEQFVAAQLFAEDDFAATYEAFAEAAEYAAQQQQADRELRAAFVDFERASQRQEQALSFVHFAKRVLSGASNFIVYRPKNIPLGTSQHFNHAQKRNDLNPQFKTTEQ